MELSPEEWAPTSKSKSNINTSFTFLAVEPQNERPRLSAGVRRQMKSHLTLLQHKRARQERAAKISNWLTGSLGRQSQRESTTELVNSGMEGLTVKVKREHSGHSSTNESAEAEAEAEVRWPIGNRQSQSHDAKTAWQHCHQLPSSALEQAFSRGSMAFKTFALHDSANVIGKSLSRLQLDVSSVLVSAILMPI